MFEDPELAEWVEKDGDRLAGCGRDFVVEAIELNDVPQAHREPRAAALHPQTRPTQAEIVNRRHAFHPAHPPRLSGTSPRIATELDWLGSGDRWEDGVARPLRFQYPGAVDHVMARGDGGKTVFQTDDDRLVFLKRLEETCGSCGWRVNAWVLMGKVRKRSKSGCVRKDHGEKDAERLILERAPDLGLPTGAAELARLRKGDERKAMLAALLRRRTTVGFEWIGTPLKMGHPGSVSRLVCGVKRDRKLEKRVHELEKMLE